MVWRAWSDGETFAGEPGLEDAPYDVEGARLHYSAANELAATEANVDDALKGKRKTVHGMIIENQGWDGFGGIVVWWYEAVEEGRVLRRGRSAKVTKHVYETLKATTHDYDLSYLRGCGCEMSKMGKGVE